MKKLLIFALLVIISSLACEKKEDEKRCWTCEQTYVTTYTIHIDGFPKTVKFVEAVCDFDEAGIRKYEAANSDTIVSVTDAFTRTQTIVMKCE